MKSMDFEDDKTEVEKLSQTMTKIQNLFYKKREQLEELQIEIDELREILNSLNSLVTNKSFQSADIIYSNSLQGAQKNHSDEEYFLEEVSLEKVKDTNIKRKIFSKNNDKDSKLLCILNFFDFNRAEIKFIDPGDREIRETSDDFIEIFLKEGLLKIKDNNPELILSYDYFKNSDLIDCIKISNLKSIQEYDLITSKIRELLLNKEINRPKFDR